MENDDSVDGALHQYPRPAAGASRVALRQAAIERLPSHEAFEGKAGHADGAQASALRAQFERSPARALATTLES